MFGKKKALTIRSLRVLASRAMLGLVAGEGQGQTIAFLLVVDLNDASLVPAGSGSKNDRLRTVPRHKLLPLLIESITCMSV